MLDNFKQFVSSKKKPGQEILDSLTPQRASIAHMLAGVQDEMFELSKALGNNDEENIKEELGDLAFYVVGLAEDYGIQLNSPEQATALNEDSFEDVITAVKRDIYYCKPIDLDKLKSDLEDLLVVVNYVGDAVGQTFESLLQANQDKLNKRYSNGYSDKSAQERVDKQ